MNILYIIDKFPVGGGTETVTRILSHEFILRGHKVCICCFFLYESDVFVNEQIKIFNFPQEGCTKKNIKYLNKILTDERIDIIINQENPIQTGRLCYKARKGTKNKLILVHHFSLLMGIHLRCSFLARNLPNCIVHFGKKIKEMHRMNSLYDWSDIVVLLSSKFIEHYNLLEPCKNLDKLRCIANPLTFEFKPVDLLKKQKTLIFVARILEKEKRPSLVLDVWKKIHGKHLDWSLIFVGDGPDLPALKEKAKNLPRIEFSGFQNPCPYFEKASILLQTSAKDFEGFGLVLVEAQQFGCVPIAMNSYISLSDIITNEENGLIVPDNDMEVFAEKIELLMNNAELRRKLAINGIETCRKFSVDKIVNEWEKLFYSLL